VNRTLLVTALNLGGLDATASRERDADACEMLSDGEHGMCMRGSVPPAPWRGALHCRSVSAPIGAVPLVREQVLGIDPAIGSSTARGGHALGVAGEQAIAGIAPWVPLQAVPILYGPSRRGRY
jgi:hypothetical protein